MGTPSKVTRSAYHGVMVLKESMPSASSMATSNSAVPSPLVLVMRPEIFRITLPVAGAIVPAMACRAAARKAAGARARAPDRPSRRRRLVSIDI